MTKHPIPLLLYGLLLIFSTKTITKPQLAFGKFRDYRYYSGRIQTQHAQEVQVAGTLTTDASDAFLCMRAKEALQRLERDLRELSEAICRAGHGAWCFDGSQIFIEREARERAAEVYRNIWFLDERDGRTTDRLCGVIAMPASTEEAVAGINHAKQELQHLLQRLESRSRALALDVIADGRRRTSEEMRELGMGRLSKKAAFRPIRYLERTPAFLSFGRAAFSKSIRVMSLDEARDALLAAGDPEAPHIAIQLSQLGRLGSHDRLAQVQSLPVHFKVNGVFHEVAADGGRATSRMTVDASMPFICRADDLFPTCQVAQMRSQRRRADRKIEEEPFLPSIRAHRYFGEF